MRELPRDPYAFQARIMDALLGDIADRNSTTFARLDALREVSKTTRESPLPNKRGDSNQ